MRLGHRVNLAIFIIIGLMLSSSGCTFLGQNQGTNVSILSSPTPSPSPVATASVTAGPDATVPDSIRLTPDPGQLTPGGDHSIVTAQLLRDGQPCARSGYTVAFFVDNADVGYLPWVNTNITDSTGQTKIVLTSGRLTGTVKVTGNSMVGIKNLSGTCFVQVSGN